MRFRLVVILIVVAIVIVIYNVRGYRHGQDLGQCAVYDSQGLPLPDRCLQDQSWR